MTNQPTVGEVLCELCCKIHPIAKYGFCGYVGGVNCPDLTQALTKLTEIIRGCVYYNYNENKTYDVVGIIHRLSKNGFLLHTKGDKNGK